ncbi:MAG: hypothetical protein M3Q03_00155 [Chloroflexota bacterium]|nr:hypothetical protein [Chloroflexota bacterium]
MARPSITRANPYTPSRGVAAGVTFTSERQYRNYLARNKGYRSWGDQQRAVRKVRTAGDVARLSPAEQAARRRALDALSRMRNDGLSLSHAAREAGTTVAAVQRHAGSALAKTARGRYRAKPSDRLVRSLPVPTRNGPITLEIRDSRAASLLGRYWSAVGRYLETGDDRALRRLRGKGITINKRFYPLITDLDVLDQLADGRELSFANLYD